MHNDLLLSLVGNYPRASTETLVEHLGQGDWDNLLHLASMHWLTQFLYYRLKQRNLGRFIPECTEHQLRTQTHGSAIVSIRLRDELAKTILALQEQGIQVIVLKGSHIAEEVYDHISLRLMEDSDLLVKKAQLAAATKVLLKSGYCWTSDLDPETEIKNKEHLPPLWKKGAHPIELHVQLANSICPIHLDLDGIWKRAKPIKIGGVESLGMSPEDLLVYLCFHLAVRHLFNIGLRPFVDISEILNHYSAIMNWDRIYEIVHRTKLERTLYLTLELTDRLLNTKAPQYFMEMIRPGRFDAKLLEWAREQVFLPRDTNLELMQWWETGRTKEKIRSFITSALPTPGFLAKKYPARDDNTQKKISYYYRLHFEDLLKRCSKPFWNRLMGDKAMIESSKRAKRKATLAEWLTL